MPLNDEDTLKIVDWCEETGCDMAETTRTILLTKMRKLNDWLYS